MLANLKRSHGCGLKCISMFLAFTFLTWNITPAGAQSFVNAFQDQQQRHDAAEEETAERAREKMGAREVHGREAAQDRPAS